ncbi:hypothetical protein KAH27_08600, partial [bacterium]|nr:hypothetical protein [bacterium]
DITVKSINGAEKTIIDGNNTNRCFYSEYVNPIIDGFTITNGYTPNYGGGIYIEGGFLQNCIIAGNLCTYQGGGIYCYETTIRNCTITENTVESYGSTGGGVHCNDGIVTNCIITKNHTTGDGGGAYCSYGKVVDCLIFDNTADDDGGGGISSMRSIVGNCTVIGNSTKYDGGGIIFSRSTIENCIISNNFATENGGGIDGFRGLIRDCLITENYAKDDGGGIHIESCDAENCTFIGNSSEHYGGGTYCRKGMIQNSILWSNTNGYHFFFGTSTNRYNCIEGWTNIVDGVITNNPEFANADAGNYQLLFSSPCINSGTNMDWMISTTDLDGNPRIIGTTVDMGAYEFVPEPCFYLSFIIYNLLIVNRRKSILLR